MSFFDVLIWGNLSSYVVFFPFNLGKQAARLQFCGCWRAYTSWCLLRVKLAFMSQERSMCLCSCFSSLIVRLEFERVVVEAKSKPLKCSILVINLGFAPVGVPVTGMASHHSDGESCEEVPLSTSFRAPVSCMNFKGVRFQVLAKLKLFALKTNYPTLYPTLEIFSTWYWGIQYATADVL